MIYVVYIHISLPTYIIYKDSLPLRVKAFGGDVLIIFSAAGHKERCIQPQAVQLCNLTESEFAAMTKTE